MSYQDTFPPSRPATPQPQIHNRLPDQPSSPDATPKKFIILITASQDVPGKLQIAREVSSAFSAPLYQGDSLHESSAKAASVGLGDKGQPNEGRYQRMWLSKLTRTGLLFPDESRAATGGFEGFGGSGSSSSTSTSRRGSASSVSSEACGLGWSSGHESEGSSTSSIKGIESTGNTPGHKTGYSRLSRPVFDIPLSEQERLRRRNPVLMVLTHPQIEKWHKLAIRNSIKEYGIAVVFVPLDQEGSSDDEGGSISDGRLEDDGQDVNQEEQDLDLPILQPLDPKTMTSFGNFGLNKLDLGARSERAPEVPHHSWEDVELKVRIDVGGDVENRREELVRKVRELIRVLVGTT